MIVHPADRLEGRLRVPGDKSVTHRALLLGAIAAGVTEIHGPGDGEDNRATASALRALGVDVTTEGEPWRVVGHGPGALRPPAGEIDCGNSGTTARLLAGLLAGAGVPARLVGDESLMRRPMARVADPLRDLGHDVRTLGEGGRLPLVVGSARPEGEESASGLRVVLKTASAQVKSAILLASLGRLGELEVVEPHPSRDHTERMLRAMGRRVASSAHYLRADAGDAADLAPTVRLLPGGVLGGRRIDVPGDLSSAAFVIAAGLLRGEGAGVTVEGVGVNPTRTGFLDALERMGAGVELTERGVGEGGEPVATVTVRRAALGPLSVEAAEVPRVIDELPLLAVLSVAAEGVSEVRGAGELRVKESDRIETTGRLVEALGGRFEALEDGWRIEGRGAASWPAFRLDVSADHRLALSAATAALAADGPSELLGHEVLRVSWPGWSAAVCGLGAHVEGDE